jgi:hypothetical protein
MLRMLLTIDYLSCGEEEEVLDSLTDLVAGNKRNMVEMAQTVETTGLDCLRVPGTV